MLAFAWVRPNQARSRATVGAILEAATYILLRTGYGVHIASQAIVVALLRRHVEQPRTAIRARARVTNLGPMATGA